MRWCLTCGVDVHCAAALNRIIASDPFDQQLEAVLSPALGPLLSAIGRTPALSNAIASALNDNSAAVSRPAHLSRAPAGLQFSFCFQPGGQQQIDGVVRVLKTCMVIILAAWLCFLQPGRAFSATA